jgi:hypothetical protein
MFTVSLYPNTPGEIVTNFIPFFQTLCYGVNKQDSLDQPRCDEQGAVIPTSQMEKEEFL